MHIKQKTEYFKDILCFNACTGKEESRQRFTARETQNKSSKIPEKAARKIGKGKETLKSS